MADHSKIEWTDATWNPVTGCSVISPGCTNCYAMRLAGTRLKHHESRAGLTRDTKAGPVWTGEVRFNEVWLTQPLQWKRPRMVFVCAHGDLFHEDVPDAWIDRVFAVMALTPQHTYQVLTKRSARMRAYMDALGASDWQARLGNTRRVSLATRLGGRPPWPLPNVWLGVSAEDQHRADERIPDLLATPAAVRLVSAEPLLGPIDFNRIPMPQDEGRECSALEGHEIAGMLGNAIGWIPPLDWIIVGGENGPRMMRAEWAQSIRDQCANADVPFFFKQWGTCLPAGQAMANGRIWAPRGGPTLRAVKGITGRLLDGVEHNAMPRAA